MKRTIKMLIVSALLATASAKTLTLSEVRGMYNKAVQNAHVEAATEVNALQIKYTIALRKYYRHLSDNAKTKEDLADLVIIRNELVQLTDLKGKDLPAVDPHAGEELLKLRKTYKTARDTIEESKEAKLVELKGTLSTTLAKLQKELLAKGETEKALEVFDAIVEVEGKPVDQEAELVRDLAVGIVKDNRTNPYRYAFSNQEFKLVKGKTYTFTVDLATEGAGVIDGYDEIPNLVPAGARVWANNDEDWQAILKTYNDRPFVIKKAKNGWKTFTLTFTSHLDKKVRFALSTYKNDKVFFKNFSLTESSNPLKNILDNKKLMNKSGWENGEELMFANVGIKPGK